MREIILDTETTGLDPLSGDRIVEIAALELINGCRTENTFHSYVNPERDMPDSAFKVHGISFQFLIDKPIFSEVVDGFINFISKDKIVAHNADFDIRFINSELARLGYDAIDGQRVIDTLSIARRKHPGASNSLDALCVRYGVDRAKRVKHGALVDCELLADVYAELLGGRQIGLELATFRVVRKAVEKNVLRQRTDDLGLFLSPEEIEAHVGFKAAQGERSFWRKYTGTIDD
jgi:DNA polymerase III subunit epsilon